MLVVDVAVASYMGMFVVIYCVGDDGVVVDIVSVEWHACDLLLSSLLLCCCD